MNYNTTKEAFVAAFEFISAQSKDRDHVIEFKPEWNNGTGYFDGLAVENTGLPIGHRFVTATPGEHSRRIVGVVTPVGNVVFFERYSNPDNDVITVNTPTSLSSLVPSGRQDLDIFIRTIGAVPGYNPNLGQSLRAVVLNVVGNAEKLIALKAGSKDEEVEDSEI